MRKSKPSPRSATKIDVMIGRRLKLARQINNLSQTELGELVGVTFQQVQKYERGRNRIPGARLWELAGYLGVPITFFFPSEGEEGFDRKLAEFDHAEELSIATIRKVLKGLAGVKPRVRTKMIQVIAAIGGDDED